MDAETTVDLGPHMQPSPDLFEDDPERMKRQTEVAKAKNEIMDGIPCLRHAEPILDVGPGRGWGALELRRRAPGVTIICLTPFEEEAEHLAALGLTVEIGIQEAMPFDWANRFRLVRASHVLEHSPAPVLAIREYYRVLCDGGYCQITIPQASGHTGLGNPEPKRIGSFIAHPFCASCETVIEMARHTGFKFVSYREVPQYCGETLQYFHRVWLLRKPHAEGA